MPKLSSVCDTKKNETASQTGKIQKNKLPRGRNAYIFFSADCRAEYKADASNTLTFAEIGKAIGFRWKELSAEEKAVRSSLIDLH